jgi:hypothetical protein
VDDRFKTGVHHENFWRSSHFLTAVLLKVRQRVGAQPTVAADRLRALADANQAAVQAI